MCRKKKESLKKWNLTLMSLETVRLSFLYGSQKKTIFKNGIVLVYMKLQRNF